jgi:hypothetical protein
MIHTVVGAVAVMLIGVVFALLLVRIIIWMEKKR